MDMQAKQAEASRKRNDGCEQKNNHPRQDGHGIDT